MEGGCPVLALSLKYFADHDYLELKLICCELDVYPVKGVGNWRSLPSWLGE